MKQTDVKTIGIVGAAGTVGRVVVRKMLAWDPSLRIVALVRRKNAHLSGLKRCEPIEGDIFDPNALERLVGNSDLIVNLAARNPVGLDEDWAARGAFFLSNGLAAGLVAAAAERRQLPLVHFSTVAVYETAAYSRGRPLSEEEDMPHIGGDVADFYRQALDWLRRAISMAAHPIGFRTLVDRYRKFLADTPCPRSAPIYGLSKLIGEQLTLEASLRLCCIRMSDVYGPGHESRGVVVDHLHRIERPATPVIDFGFRQGIYFIYIDDIARMLTLLVERLFRKSASVPKVINFCGRCIDSSGMHVHLSKVCRAHGIECRFEVAPTANRLFDRRYSNATFDRVFPGFERTPFGKGLELTFSAFRAAQQAERP